jgi:predicted GNAT family N-acyltransferase
MMIYRSITTHDPEYLLEKALRERVLREPLGLTLTENDIRDDDEQVHVVAMNDNGCVIGCVLLAFSDMSARVRQMAVELLFRKKGIGSELLRVAERTAAERGAKELTMHARASAQRFYEKRGYTAISEVFTEVTLPHVRMRKVLTT